MSQIWWVTKITCSNSVDTIINCIVIALAFSDYIITIVATVACFWYKARCNNRFYHKGLAYDTLPALKNLEI